MNLGMLLFHAGEREHATPILERSRDGFFKLGQPGNAAQIEQLLGNR